MNASNRGRSWSWRCSGGEHEHGVVHRPAGRVEPAEERLPVDVAAGGGVGDRRVLVDVQQHLGGAVDGVLAARVGLDAG
jgi:hypothetical protein